jgi:tol-pal system protein YbgF
MKIKALPTLFLFCSCFNAVASTESVIKSKSLNFDSNDMEMNRLDAQEKEIQNLLGRIEVLEHTVSNLKIKLDPQNAPLERGITTQQSETPQLIDKQNGGDIFDIPSANTDQENLKPSVIKEKEATTEKKLYDLALAALKDNKLDIAEEKFTSFIKTYPKSSLQSNAYFWHGETFFKRKMFDKAAISYLKGYKQFPKAAKASDSLLKLALSLGELKKKEEACGILSKLESEFPNRAAASIKRAKDSKIKFGCK